MYHKLVQCTKNILMFFFFNLVLENDRYLLRQNRREMKYCLESSNEGTSYYNETKEGGIGWSHIALE